MKYLIALMTLILLAPAQAGWMMERPDPLAGSEWLVLEINGQPANGEAYLQFRGAGKVAGNTGVNSLASTYRVRENSIDFGPWTTTRMAGAPDSMKQEARLLESLDRVNGFSRQRIHLALLVDGRTVLKLRQTDFD